MSTFVQSSVISIINAYKYSTNIKSILIMENAWFCKLNYSFIAIKEFFYAKENLNYQEIQLRYIFDIGPSRNRNSITVDDLSADLVVAEAEKRVIISILYENTL